MTMILRAVLTDLNSILVLVVTLSIMEGVVKPFLGRLGRDKYDKLDQLFGDRLPNHPSRDPQDTGSLSTPRS